MINVKKLKGKIIEAGYTQKKLAEAVGLSENTLSYKIRGKRDFTTGEIDRICKVIHITDNQQKAQIFLA